MKTLRFKHITISKNSQTNAFKSDNIPLVAATSGILTNQNMKINPTHNH